MSIEKIDIFGTRYSKRNEENQRLQKRLEEGMNGRIKAAPFHDSLRCGIGFIRIGRHSAVEGVTAHIYCVEQKWRPKKHAGFLQPGSKSSITQSKLGSKWQQKQELQSARQFERMAFHFR